MTDSSSALVTGAGSGIGRALATQLASRGAAVHLVDIDEQAVLELASDLGGAKAVPGDVADPSAMARIADAVGAVDVLCLNAGVVSAVTGAPWEADPSEWDRVLGVNLLGVVNGLRSFVPLMLEAAGPSQIIITASLAGAATWPGGGPYAASKHAVLAVAEQACLELAETNVAVTVLCPALVRTGMSDSGDDPRDVAAEALRAADEGRFAVVATEWHGAVERRAIDLTTGRAPVVPTPGM